MPWRPTKPREFPTLGYLIGDWIEDNCVIPDGIKQGDKYILTDEMWIFLVWYYRLKPDAIRDDQHPSAAFEYRGGLLMRPQKWGKGPFAGTICCAEAFGPVRFAGWDDDGQPMGQPAATPWIQIVATSEDQTDNTWLALHETVTRGPLANEPGVDIGIEDINLPGGGKIEPRTASADARLGARITFAVFDESHLMVQSNGGLKMANNMMRGLSGTGGRWLQTTNAYDPSQQSVAQRTHEGKASDVFIDYRPPRRTPDLTDRPGALAELAHVYGDSYWVDLPRIYADAIDPAVCPTPGDAYRFFFNLPVVGISEVVDPTLWQSLTRDNDLKPDETIALGFDGSRSSDCTSVVASRVSDGRWFHLKTWNPADYGDHQIPRLEVEAVVANAFKTYDVRFLYADPYHWETDLQRWLAQWPRRVITFPTNSEKRMDAAIQRFLVAISGGLTHDGDPIFSQHIRAAALAQGGRKQPRPEEDPSVVQHYLKVVKKRSAGHIDALIAGILAEEARGKAIEEGALTSGSWTAL